MNVRVYSAKVYELTDDDGRPLGRVIFHHDPATYFADIYRVEWEVYDDGDAENGPHLAEDAKYVWIGTRVGPPVTSGEEAEELFNEAVQMGESVCSRCSKEMCGEEVRWMGDGSVMCDRCSKEVHNEEVKRRVEG